MVTLVFILFSHSFLCVIFSFMIFSSVMGGKVSFQLGSGYDCISFVLLLNGDFSPVN